MANIYVFVALWFIITRNWKLPVLYFLTILQYIDMWQYYAIFKKGGLCRFLLIMYIYR